MATACRYAEGVDAAQYALLPAVAAAAGAARRAAETRSTLAILAGAPPASERSCIIIEPAGLSYAHSAAVQRLKKNGWTDWRRVGLLASSVGAAGALSSPPAAEHLPRAAAY